METTTTTNVLVDSHTEFRDDLIKQGRNIKLEITAETYAEPIFKATNTHGDIFSWIFLAEHHEGFPNQKWEAGHKYYPKALSLDELKEEVRILKADPFSLMIEHYAKEYTK